jgi:hypothetical protein
MTSTFRKVPPKVVPAVDPHKYVNYTLGMLLGVDDFLQEHAYLSGYDHWLTRELLGYGTASGLHVSTDIDGEKGPRVLVDPGVAVSPRGQLIRVTPSQCAYLNEWLAANKDKLDEWLEANKDKLNEWLAANKDKVGNTPIYPLTLYVVLSYRACESDTVPISGEPCRSEDSLMASSRLSDNFTLELSLNAPDQREEAALRAFVAWLRQVQVADPQTKAEKDFTSMDQFAQAIRTAAQNSDPNSPSTFMTNAPPTGLRISANTTCDYWQTAFRIWATELRPKWRAYCTDGDVPDEDRLLLAELSLLITQTLSGDWQVYMPPDGTPPVNVNEQNRPRLLHLRLLQEWMLCGRRETPPSDDVAREVTFGQNPAPGTMDSYSRGDHTHGTPGLAGDVISNNDGTVTVQGLRNIPVASRQPKNGQVLKYSAKRNRWQPSHVDVDVDLLDIDVEIGDEDEHHEHHEDHEHHEHHEHHHDHEDDSNLSGDITRNEDGSTSVQGLRGIPIADAPPAPGQVLRFNGERWEAVYLPRYVEYLGPTLYVVAAAGWVRGDGQSERPSYNGLRVEAQQNQSILVRFDGYEWPIVHPYIVKVLPGLHHDRRPAFIHFDSFTQEGIVLRVYDGQGSPFSHEELLRMSLMVEVSQYQASPAAQSKQE